MTDTALDLQQAIQAHHPNLPPNAAYLLMQHLHGISERIINCGPRTTATWTSRTS